MLLFLVATACRRLLVILPTNAQLLDPQLDRNSMRAAALLSRWNRLHAVRTILSGASFALFPWRISGGAWVQQPLDHEPAMESHDTSES